MSTSSTHSARKASANHLNRQLGLYSLAAATAGVSLLALAQPADAEVVITKKTIPIPISPFGMPEFVKISVANNGIDNFSFSLYSTKADRGLRVTGASRADGLITGGTFYAEALALPRGAKIGPSAAFFNYTELIEATETSDAGRNSRGYWGGNVKNRYLGVRFPIDGETHYGWIRLTVTIDLKPHGPYLSAKITAYAYETEPNQPILAGTSEKSSAEVQLPENIQNQAGPSLGMLATGADGLPLWRREEALISK
jgi:hypothetical protein